MRKFRFIGTIVVLLLSSASLLLGQDTAKITDIVKQVGQQVAPDSRMAVWSISARSAQGEKIVISGETNKKEGIRLLKEKLAQNSLRDEIEYDITQLPDSTLGEKTAGIIRVGVAHLRREPTHATEMISQGILGAPVTLLKKHRGYYYVQMEDGYIGWMSTFAIHPVTPNAAKQWLESGLGVYNKVIGFIYQKPNQKSDPVSDISLGSRVKILNTEDGWTAVMLPDGRQGYILSDELYTMKEFSSIKPDAENIIALGKKLMGISYTWGGTSTRGLDCSGFIQTIFRMNGVQLPRDANMQVNVGTPIDTSANFTHLKPGDLLFFGHSPDHITHVGMYIGNLEFIHESGMVKINSFDPKASNYNKRRRHGLQKVKRVL